MRQISTLLVGVLVVVAMLAITSAIIALAPYIAGVLVVLGLGWYCLRSEPLE